MWPGQAGSRELNGLMIRFAEDILQVGSEIYSRGCGACRECCRVCCSRLAQSAARLETEQTVSGV